jgi:hypothetical protein
VELCRLIAAVVFDYTLTGETRSLGGPKREKAVEYGFARFCDEDNVQVDEPITLLAATEFFNTRTPWTTSHFLAEDMGVKSSSARGVAFEQFSAYLIGTAFKSPRRLSDVFRFVKMSPLGKMHAELVAVRLEEGELNYTTVDISSRSGPTYIMGHTSHSNQATLEWLRDPKGTVFHFPANTIGPDVILFLKLSDGRIIAVLVQCKQISAPTLGDKATKNALRATDPEQMTSRRRKRKRSSGVGSRRDKGRESVAMDDQRVGLMFDTVGFSLTVACR